MAAHWRRFSGGYRESRAGSRDRCNQHGRAATSCQVEDVHRDHVRRESRLRTWPTAARASGSIENHLNVGALRPTAPGTDANGDRIDRAHTTSPRSREPRRLTLDIEPLQTSSRVRGSNSPPHDYKSSALPTELTRRGLGNGRGVPSTKPTVGPGRITIEPGSVTGSPTRSGRQPRSSQLTNWNVEIRRCSRLVGKRLGREHATSEIVSPPNRRVIQRMSFEYLLVTVSPTI